MFLHELKLHLLVLNIYIVTKVFINLDQASLSCGVVESVLHIPQCVELQVLGGDEELLCWWIGWYSLLVAVLFVLLMYKLVIGNGTGENKHWQENKCLSCIGNLMCA